MRILIAGLYASDPRQGSPKVLLRLGAELSRLGHEVDFIFVDALPRWMRNYRLSWFLFPVAVLIRVMKASWQRMPYDVVDVSGGDGWLLAIVASWLTGRPIVVCRSHGWEHQYAEVVSRNPHTQVANWRRGLLTRILRLPMVAASARCADAIIVASSLGRAYALERGWSDPDRVVVIPCGVDSEFFLQSDPSRNGGILYVGSWLRTKGVIDLAKAYQLVLESGIHIPLSIVGFGKKVAEVLEAFSPAARSMIRISDSLRTIDERELIGEYAKHNLFVFPSLFEGFGMVALEAMATGLAVIATPVGGIVDIIVDDKNGVIVPIGDSEALAAAIIDLWGSGEKRQRLGNAAQQAARQFVWPTVAQRTLNIYGALVEGRASSKAVRS